MAILINFTSNPLANMKTIDLQALHPSYFRALPYPELITLDERKYITLIGYGPAGSDEMSRLIKTLYAVAQRLQDDYRLHEVDLKLPWVESEWWSDNLVCIHQVPATSRRWKLMIQMPDDIEAAQVEEAKKKVILEDGLAAAIWVRTEHCQEEAAVQMLHVGHWSTEKETITAINEYIDRNHLVSHKHHHEVYLSDPHKTDPSRLRTIIRQDVLQRLN